jgi:serine/threonine-protein kinase
MADSEFQSFADALAGQYTLDREIGRGGMGVVYLALDPRLDRQVAIKTLPPHLATDALVRERFLREARTAAALSHPNIVPIYRADELGGRVFFVMGYVDGRSLAQRIRDDGPLSPRDAAAVLRDVALALECAHERSVVHRDIKAENILLDAGTGRAMVTDFGIARVTQAAPLTATGHVLGSVHYMSPEQVAGEAVDPRSDLYSLGVVGFLALTGRFPFDSETASAILVAHVTSNAPRLSSVAPQLPGSVCTIIDRCLSRERDERYATAAEVIDALDAAAGDIARAASAPRPLTGVVSETEAQEVWRRAAELQAQSTPLPPVPASDPDAAPRTLPAELSRGYRLRDVRAAAGEAGIDQAFVEHALRERGLAPNTSAVPVGEVIDTSPDPHPLAGSEMRIQFEAVVDGEMPVRDFDLLHDLIRREIGEVGSVSSVGRSFAWSLSNGNRKLSVSVVPRAGRTTIVLDEALGSLAGGVFGGGMGGFGGGLGGAIAGIFVPQSGLVFLGGWLGFVGLTYVGARLVYRRLVQRRKSALERLGNRLVRQVTESVSAEKLESGKVEGRRMLR